MSDIKMVVLPLISGLFTWNIFLPPFSLRGCMSLMIKGGSWIKQKDKSCLYIYFLSLFIWTIYLRLLMWKNINEVFADSHHSLVIIVIRLLLLLLQWLCTFSVLSIMFHGLIFSCLVYLVFRIMFLES